MCSQLSSLQKLWISYVLSFKKNQDYASAQNDFEYYNQRDTFSPQKERKSGCTLSSQAIEEPLGRSTLRSRAYLSLKQQKRREKQK